VKAPSRSRHRVTAPARLGTGKTAKDGEALAWPVAIVDSVDHPDVLGKEDVSWIGTRQFADHFDYSGYTDR
jgi:hypothetical protein